MPWYGLLQCSRGMSSLVFCMSEASIIKAGALIMIDEDLIKDLIIKGEEQLNYQ